MCVSTLFQQVKEHPQTASQSQVCEHKVRHKKTPPEIVSGGVKVNCETVKLIVKLIVKVV